MNRLKRFYNQNSKGIWTLAIIIAFFLVLLKLLNLWSAKKINEEYKNNSSSTNSILQTENNINLESEKSVVTGEKKVSSNLNKEVQTIQEFLNSCENKDTTKAYEMLTDECKEQLYNSEDEFVEQYCNINFKDNSMNFNIENWVNSTYKVKMFDDIMSTGKYEDGPVVQDYITVEKEKNEYKLNINNYIGKNLLNKETTKNNITIKVINRNIYMDYEIYDLEVKNNTENDILLDTKENLESMYIKDTKNVKYSSYSHEISLADLYVQKGQKRNLKIKYYSSYNSGKKIKEIGFSNVIMEYNKEDNTINREKIQELKVSI